MLLPSLDLCICKIAQYLQPTAATGQGVSCLRSSPDATGRFQSCILVAGIALVQMSLTFP